MNDFNEVMDDAFTLDAEQAYLTAKAGRELFGGVARPWTPSRAVAAQTMGMIFPMIGEEGQASLNTKNTYPGILQDVVIVCWLCTLPDDVSRQSDGWTPSRALRSPTKAFDAAMVWGEKVGVIDMRNAKYVEGVKFFISIFSDEAASNFKVDVEGSSEQQTEGEQGNV